MDSREMRTRTAAWPWGLTVFFIVFFCVINPHTVLSAQKKNSCVTAKCHSTMGKEKFVHGPVAVGNCVVCHVQEGKHKFAPIKKDSHFCYKCHDRLDTKKFVHKPVKDGACTLCHSPHQSPYKYQLRAARSELCLRCHEKKFAKAKYIHGPVAVGGCIVCHNPHESNHPKMLMAEGNNVCFQCHIDKAKEFKTAKYIHPPVKQACINCHSPHTGRYRYQLNADGSRALCFECHPEKKKWIESVKVKHGGLYTKKKCLACHDPHFAKYPDQLIKQPMDLCLMCHNRPMNTPDGKIIDMKTYLAENKYKHGPIRQKDCTACHNPHGSNNFRILRKYFPPTFYAPFDVKDYALCFTCHEKSLVMVKRTTTLTGFRNGDLNLHYFHVHRKKGRTCRACHNMHATNNPKHIRDSVPFGTWQLPLNYKKTATGGSCLPGCHQRFAYDRNHPVKNR